MINQTRNFPDEIPVAKCSFLKFIWSSLLIMFVGNPAFAEESVAVELVLAVDTSISVSSQEYRLQMVGIAEALRSSEVVDTILRQPNGVAVTLVHWSVGGLNYQSVDWHHLRDLASILHFANTVERAPRRATGRGTSIAHAIDFSTRLFITNGFVGEAQIIDISGDSRSNSGPLPNSARDRAVLSGIQINGLVIPDGDRELVSYFQFLVIGGESAFVMSVGEDEDFTSAMQRKLARELDLLVAEYEN